MAVSLVWQSTHIIFLIVLTVSRNEVAGKYDRQMYCQTSDKHFNESRFTSMGVN